MLPKLEFDFEGDKLIIKGLPSHLQPRGIKYSGKSVATLRHLTVASANITAAKFYMDAIKKATKETDAYMYDAALLAAIVKYGSVFKPDSKGRVIDAARIFTSKLVIINNSLSKEPIVMEDPDLTFWKRHQRLLTLRDKMIAHDDRLIGTSECFAVFDAGFKCEHVVGLTQRTTVYSAIKSELTSLPMCIDIVLTWLADEKTRHCQIVNDEINTFEINTRQNFPEPIFERYRGLSDAEERKTRQEPYWEYDWSTGEKRQAKPAKEVKPDGSA